MSCFEGKNGRKPLITCKTVGYTYIMTYMLESCGIPGNFGTKVMGVRSIFLAARIFLTSWHKILPEMLEGLLGTTLCIRSKCNMGWCTFCASFTVNNNHMKTSAAKFGAKFILLIDIIHCWCGGITLKGGAQWADVWPEAIIFSIYRRYNTPLVPLLRYILIF